MIDRVSAQRRYDREHLEWLSAQVNEGLPEWCARVRRTRAAAMVLLLVALPAALYFALPQREPVMVACNMEGGESQVVDCARNLISIT